MAGPFGLEMRTDSWRSGGGAQRRRIVHPALALLAACLVLGALPFLFRPAARDAELLRPLLVPLFSARPGDDAPDTPPDVVAPAAPDLATGAATGAAPDVAADVAVGVVSEVATDTVSDTGAPAGEPMRPGAPSATLIAPLALFLGLAAALASAFLLGHRSHRARREGPIVDLLLERADLEGRPACLTDGKGRIRALNAAARSRIQARHAPRPRSARDNASGTRPATEPPPRDIAAFVSRCLPGGRAPHPGTIRRILLAGRRINLPLGDRSRERLVVLPAGRNRLLWEIAAPTSRTAAEADVAPLAAAVLVVSRSGRLLAANPAAEALLGPLPSHLEALVSDRPLRPHGVHPVRTRDGVRAMRIITLEREGGLRQLHFFPVDDAQSMAAGVEAVIDRLPTPLLKLSPDGRIRHANRAATALLGISARPDLALGDLVEGPGMPVGRWIARALNSEEGLPPETVRLSRQEEERHVRVSLVRGLEDGRLFILAHLHDTTALKRMEAQIAQSQRMHAIGQLAGGIAHDFNNLLAILSARSEELLELLGEADTAAKEQIVAIRATIERGARLVRRILAFSRRQPMRLRPLALAALLEEAAGLLAPLLGRGIDLVIAPVPEEAVVEADPAALEQIVINIAVNARDAMNGKGTLHISSLLLALESPARLRGAPVSLPAGKWAVLSLRDTGPGLPEEQIARLFEPFFTTKPPGKGTGLGLAMCYGLMKQMGGYVFARNHPEGGAEFLLCLPLAVPAEGEEMGGKAAQTRFEVESAALVPPATGLRGEGPPRPLPKPLPTGEGAPDGSTAPVDDPADGKRPVCAKGDHDAACREEEPSVAAPTARTVVLVEDEAPLRRFIHRSLELEGYRVLSFASGEEALRHLLGEKSPPCDLILSDITLPGCDGPSWIARYRAALATRRGSDDGVPQGADPSSAHARPVETAPGASGHDERRPGTPRRRPPSPSRSAGPEVRVLLMSGGGPEPEGGTGAVSPSCGFLHKPFDRKTLIEEVARAFAQGAPLPEG